MLSRLQYFLGQIAWVGALCLALTAASAFAAGPKVYIGNFKDNTVSVIDTGWRLLVRVAHAEATAEVEVIDHKAALAQAEDQLFHPS